MNSLKTWYYDKLWVTPHTELEVVLIYEFPVINLSSQEETINCLQPYTLVGNQYICIVCTKIIFGSLN